MSLTTTVLQQKYPAKAHCRRVTKYLTEQGLPSNAIIYLEARKRHLIEDTDQEVPFRQRRPFFYLSGCKTPNACLVYSIPQDKLTLFIPQSTRKITIWAGRQDSAEEALEKYDVDEVLYLEDLDTVFTQYKEAGTTSVYAIHEQTSDGITLPPFLWNFTALRGAIDECRVIKDSYEIALIRKANEISTIGHLEAQKAAQIATNEEQVYGAFIGACIANGAHEQAYHAVCAAGHSCATLHYVQNDQPLHNRLNILIDAGAEYDCYCADVTRTFPISGTFTLESQSIYDLVKEMQESCFNMLHAGILWEDIHLNAHKVAARGLLKLGILQAGTEYELLERRVTAVFMPHGLGHYLGMDCHDTGGHPDYSDPDPILKPLRLRGVLPAGAVVTVEPGLYFCRSILDSIQPELVKYINKEVLNKYWDVGGVRIEDNVLIKLKSQGGWENLTNTPKM